MLAGSILEQLHNFHKDTQPLNLGVYYKNTLVALCHALEDFILQSEDRPILIAAFQQGKWYFEEAERYQHLAERASQVAILAAADSGFTEHPTSRLPNVDLIGLDASDPVTDEWHLMILSSDYTAMVLCQELSEDDYGIQGYPENDCERKFYGFWTFEPELVKETVTLTAGHIEAYHPELASSLRDRLNNLNPSTSTLPAPLLNAVVSSVVTSLQESQNQLCPENSQGIAYQVQSLTENLRSNKIQALLRMAQVTDRADLRNPNSGAEVANLSEVMGQLLDLPAWQVKRLRLAGLLHRLPPLQILPAILDPEQTSIQQEVKEESCDRSKSSILRIMPQLQAIAHIISHQTEHWDGSGTPEGLAYDRIPIESRILSLTSTFISQSRQREPLQALEHCEALAGEQFDPKLVETLALLVKGMQQGLQLSSLPPKIASGIWLLDDEETPVPSLQST
ncbi:DICT sensory domain-containing protein [Roseofilum casamattae]|uniref:DICT sensory domain-containing protein n=1 Tax=Roseofilum casamattae BLCC-M143 TaxID=3022442 RepID=A0ABT7C1N0_9CYAN|nr:DICT sensory domain-containing protein [Roseofilum casamattae]MDJ1185357.1 DICT sensory domain-containing protein [Roseofilum casamattae BLCC-M143]